MTNTAEFCFPGFALIGNRDSDTHYCPEGRLNVGGVSYTVELIRRKDLPETANFLLSAVKKDGYVIWSFKSQNFNGIGVLAMAGSDPVIALVVPGKDGGVQEVIPFSSFSGEGESDMVTLIQMKKSAAEYLRRRPLLSELELKVLKKSTEVEETEEEKQARLAKMAEEIEAAKAREAAREEARKQHLAKMLARETLVGYTADGRVLNGIPVVGDEWMRLPDKTKCIEVESYDEETGEAGALIRAFIVKKVPGKHPKDDFSVVVFAEEPKKVEKKIGPMPTGETAVRIDGKFKKVLLFKTTDEIAAVRSAGLNGGALVAVDQRDDHGRIDVRAVHKDKVDSVGFFKPVI